MKEQYPPGSDDVQKIAEIKEYLEARISDLEIELARLREMLVLVDSKLRQKSFVPAIALHNIESTKTLQVESFQSKQSNKSQPAVGPRSQDRKDKSSTIPPSTTKECQLRRTKDSMILAIASVEENKVVIVPSKEVNFSRNTPPFESFFINRILTGFKKRDEDLVKSGKLKPGDALQFNVVETQGSISSVTVSNYREAATLNEILSTITWAFTRMLEKK